MDVLSLPRSRVVPFGPPDLPPYDERARTRLVDRLARLLGVRRNGALDPRGDERATDLRRNVLLGYTAAEIVLGVGLLAIVTAAVPIADTIASSALASTALAGSTGGVLLWTMFGLLGSVRTVSSAAGPGHFTFHLPFVGAAMILGGPTAGAWVAMLSTIDRRELESQPWYGVLANHASIATAAVAGGAAYALVHAGLLAATGDEGMARFAAILVAGVVLETIANAFAVTTIKVRDEMSWAAVLGIVIDDFRRETILEIALIWVLVIAFASVGWWAPLVVGIGVIWYLAHERGEGPDALTGLVRKRTFVDRTDRKVGWIRRGILTGGTMLYVDLNRFHVVNNQHGHEVGDAALKVVADRLREVFPRHEDILSRLMGDEFGVFLVGLTSTEVAIRKAEQLIEAICRPIPTPVGPVSVGAAVGVVVVRGGGLQPSAASTLMRRSEQAMYLAKSDPSPCGGWHVWSADDPTPFSGEWVESAR